MPEFLTPRCPLCGEPPMMVMGGGTQAFCGNDSCKLLAWSPARSLADNLMNASLARWEPSGGGVATPHEPSAACGDTHCFWHNVDEPGNGAYRICGECCHVYRTAEDLRQAWFEATLPGEGDMPPADQIHDCPLCSHGW